MLIGGVRKSVLWAQQRDHTSIKLEMRLVRVEIKAKGTSEHATDSAKEWADRADEKIGEIGGQAKDSAQKPLDAGGETADQASDKVGEADKSGEYFGYARMASSISDGCTTEPNNDLDAKATVKIEDHNFPTFIATPATNHAPSGRIVDNSTRGTIF